MNNFEHLVYIGKSVLNHTSNDIQELFFHKEMCLYEYLYKEKSDKGLEIILDDHVLVCIFENDNCRKSILYFNKADDLPDSIRYCDTHFEYDPD